jgi:hypothetical protein
MLSPEDMEFLRKRDRDVVMDSGAAMLGYIMLGAFCLLAFMAGLVSGLLAAGML